MRTSAGLLDGGRLFESPLASGRGIAEAWVSVKEGLEIKKVVAAAALVLAPFFSVCAIIGGICMYMLPVAERFGLTLGRSLPGQLLPAAGLVWASHYLFVRVVAPKERYGEALTRLSMSRLGTACIGFSWIMLFLTFSRHGVIALIALTLTLPVAVFGALAIIPAMVIETLRHASVIAGYGKMGYWTSLGISISFLFVLPLLIILGLDMTMAVAVPAHITHCPPCKC
ncbi:MAG: hypothetical protein HZB85_06840 [Deltaproteobacteria bacterium]|nr:hypothetical protein [Deltaproteobacteria bacterium]